MAMIGGGRRRRAAEGGKVSAAASFGPPRRPPPPLTPPATRIVPRTPRTMPHWMPDRTSAPRPRTGPASRAARTHRPRPATEHPGDERREQRIHHLTREIVEKGYSPEQLALPWEGGTVTHPGRVPSESE